MEQFIGKEVESQFNLNMNNNDKVQLITKGKNYKVIDVVNKTSFIIKNDLGRFDHLSITYFSVPELDNN